MNIKGLDAYLTTEPGDRQDALTADEPEYCACGARLTDGDWQVCVLCAERIDLGRLDGPDYGEEGL